MKTNFLTVATILGVLTLSSCTKLEPKLDGPVSIAPNTAGGAPTPPSISAVYEQLNQLTGGQGNWIAMEEHSTDEIMGPTRGTDWDDFGEWRRLHLHTWAGDHAQIVNTWNGLNGALFQTTLIAETATDPRTRAEGQFLRSFFRYLVCDLYGQVQTRPATAPAAAIPSVLSRSQAIDVIITELEGAVANLPAYNRSLRTLATKEAAWALLAKCYLNKAVYKSDPTKPEGPYTFAASDMNKVIENCNLVQANTLLQVDTYYWDNFKWDNGTASTENIFVRHNNTGDVRAGGGAGLRWQTSQSFHYNQTPSSWNGFVTLSDFYDSFEGNDVRRSDTLANYTNRTGATAGLLLGQARGPENSEIGRRIVDLKDRAGNALIFTRDASMFFNSEAKGIRVNKFPLDPSSLNDGGWGSSNEFPFFRLSDVRLMEAEAILRGGTSTETPVVIVNEIRSRRRTSNVTSVTLPFLLAERARELYLEGHRRTDMVRYGVFNNPVQERASRSDGYKCVYSLPTITLASNPNLKQNFGY